LYRARRRPRRDLFADRAAAGGAPVLDLLPARVLVPVSGALKRAPAVYLLPVLRGDAARRLTPSREADAADLAARRRGRALLRPGSLRGAVSLSLLLRARRSGDPEPRLRLDRALPRGLPRGALRLLYSRELALPRLSVRRLGQTPRRGAALSLRRLERE